jgi:non-specific serine/threonine protein kinase/serine/threonine-protein kinase
LSTDSGLERGCPRCLLSLAKPEPEPLSLSAALTSGTTIGHYRILRFIGEGGMGMVYEAEQEHPRRTVALKLIKPGWASAELLRRFEMEWQALGRLQHPGIAQIYEAGTSDTVSGPQTSRWSLSMARR